MIRTPQVENGYTRIAHLLIEELAKINLSGSEWQILMAVIRKTYGFNKKLDRISLSQFQKFTGMDRKSVCRALKRLVAKQLLLKSNFCYGINKNYHLWGVAIQPVANQPVANMSQGSGKYVPQLVAIQPHTKDTLTKDIIQKKEDSLTLTKTKELLKDINDKSDWNSRWRQRFKKD